MEKKKITLPVSSVTLNGSGSYADSYDGSTIDSYVWTQISGPKQVTLTVVGTLPSPVANVTGMTIVGIYTFELRVTDNLGYVGLDSVDVTVDSATDQPPQAICYGSVPPNTAAGTILMDGSQSLGNSLTFAWSQVSGPACVISNPTAIITQAILPLIGSYIFSLTVTDNIGRTSRSQLAVSIATDFNPTTINFNT